MNYAKSVVLAAALLCLSIAWSPRAQAEVSFDLYYSNLGPHGSWLVSAEYGRVWQPSVYTRGWNPYYDGHWVYTDLGWSWVSDYGWGAIPYHYGTWVVDPAVGWVWVPGYVWAPAWVVFRTDSDYIGWAPVPPRFSINASLGFGDIDQDRFVFVPTGRFLAPRIHTCVVPVTRTRVIFNQTRIFNGITLENNVVVNRGLDVRQIEKVSGKHISAVPIERVERAVPGASLSRQAIRVGPERLKQGVMATEAGSEKGPLPQGGGRKGGPGKERLEGTAVQGPLRGDAARKQGKQGRPAPEAGFRQPPRRSTGPGYPHPYEGSARTMRPYRRQAAWPESGTPFQRSPRGGIDRRSRQPGPAFSPLRPARQPNAVKPQESPENTQKRGENKSVRRKSSKPPKTME